MKNQPADFTAPALKADGTLQVTSTTFQMCKPAEPRPPGLRIENLTVRRVLNSTVSFYRYLYNPSVDRACDMSAARCQMTRWEPL